MSFSPVENDQFRVRVTIDVDSSDYFNTEEIKRAIQDPVQSNHRIEPFIALPDQFYFREFGGNGTKTFKL